MSALGEPDLYDSALLHTPIRYWRLRWGGDDLPASAAAPRQNIVHERLRVIDRAKLLDRT